MRGTRGSSLRTSWATLSCASCFLMMRRPPRATLFPYPTLFFFNDTATTEIYTLSLHDALPISHAAAAWQECCLRGAGVRTQARSEEHTSELQSHSHLVCRLLLEKKKKNTL